MDSAELSTDVDVVVGLTIRVSRLGEADLRNWWGSRAFGTAGRVVLGQRLARTWRMAAVELDLASATNRHNEILDRSNAVHLFSDHWPVRRWASAWVAEQKTASDPDPLFEQLEAASLASIESELTSLTPASAAPVSGAHRLGTLNRSDLEDQPTILTAVLALAAAYVGNEAFVVPYFEVAG